MFKKMLSFLSDTKTILLIFLGVNLIGLIGFFLFGKLSGNQTLPYNQMLGIKILSFITYAVIVYFTYKGIKIVRLVMAAIVLLTGINGIFLGIFRIDWQQYPLKPYFIILGIYFIYGGIALFRYKKDEFLTSASRGNWHKAAALCAWLSQPLTPGVRWNLKGMQNQCIAQPQ